MRCTKAPYGTREFCSRPDSALSIPDNVGQKKEDVGLQQVYPSRASRSPGGEAIGNNSTSLGEQHPSAELQVLAVEICAPTNEEVPLILVVEPQAPTWARHIVHYLKQENFPKSKKKLKE